MLDVMFDVLVDALSKLVPDVVWGAVFLLIGALATLLGVTTILGVATLLESTRLGGILTATGVSLVIGVLFAWYR